VVPVSLFILLITPEQLLGGENAAGRGTKYYCIGRAAASVHGLPGRNMSQLVCSGQRRSFLQAKNLTNRQR
jgi:hypothetical protein